jgi:hypothetical protein
MIVTYGSDRGVRKGSLLVVRDLYDRQRPQLGRVLDAMANCGVRHIPGTSGSPD